MKLYDKLTIILAIHTNSYDVNTMTPDCVTADDKKK